MLGPGQTSYIRHRIFHPVLPAVLSLRFMFAYVDSGLLCALAVESCEGMSSTLGKGSLLKATLELTRDLCN